VPAVEPNDCIRCAGNLSQPTAGGVVDCPGVLVRRAALRTNQADLPARYASATSTHVTDVVADVMRADWTPGDPGWWLWGHPGTGKTHALVVCARILIERLGISVRWVRMPDLLARIRGTYDAPGVTERDILGPLEAADLLILDEFCSPTQSMRTGAKWRPRDFELKVSAELIDARYDRAGCTTWITSNIAPTDIRALGLHQTERMDSRLSDESMIRTKQVGGRDRRRRQEQR
jgi:DNA replication protein DnaC